jgi:Fe-S-cluster-containing dehydrogenase component
MSANGLLIHYEYCSGCSSCVVACKNEHKLTKGQWGIKLLENGPREVSPGKIEWDYIPTPTSFCDLCADRVKAGKKPTCVHHCLAACMEYGTLEELAKSAAGKGRKVVIFTDPHAATIHLTKVVAGDTAIAAGDKAEKKVVVKKPIVVVDPLAAKPGQNYGTTKYVQSKEYEGGEIVFKEEKEKPMPDKEKDSK